MKTLAVILVSSVMMITFESCGDALAGISGRPESSRHENLAVYEKYMQASEALEEAGSMGANTYMSLSVGDGDEAVVMEMTGQASAVAPGKPNMEMDSQLFINVQDGTGRFSSGWQHVYLAYYKDGYLYTHLQEMVTLNEVKNKTLTSAGEAARHVNLFAPIAFSESAIKEMNESEAQNVPDNEFQADSGIILSFTLDSFELRELLDVTAKSKLEDFLGEEGGAYQALKYGDVALTVLLDKKGKMSNINMSFPFTMTDAGGKTNAEIEMHMTITRVGGVTIDFPDNLETYESPESPQQAYEI